MNAQQPAQQSSAFSLTTFGAAVGGAVLGMLLTLLVLAVVNNGTLSFSNMAVWGSIFTISENLDRVDANVGAVSANTDTNATHIAELEAEIELLNSKLDNAIGFDIKALTTEVGRLMEIHAEEYEVLGYK